MHAPQQLGSVLTYSLAQGERASVGAMRHLVRTSHGVCAVTLAREGLDLEERGGFGARWAKAEEIENADEVLDRDAYRKLVKAYLAKIYRERHGKEPGTITLNLASHQLLDDLEGWTKLNWQPNK